MNKGKRKKEAGNRKMCIRDSRVPRVYYKNNKVVDVVNYLYGEE